MILPDNQGRIRTHFLLVVVLCRWVSGEAEAASDAAAAGWFSADEIARLFCQSALPRLARLVL